MNNIQTFYDTLSSFVQEVSINCKYDKSIIKQQIRSFLRKSRMDNNKIKFNIYNSINGFTIVIDKKIKIPIIFRSFKT